MSVFNRYFSNDPALTIAVFAIVLIGFSLPISTALDNILLGIVLIAFPLSARCRGKLGSITRNPAASALAGFFALLALGILYGDAPISERKLRYPEILRLPAKGRARSA